MTDAKLDLSAAVAAPLAALVPERWHGPTQLWQGPIRVQATAAGLPNALAVGLAVDLADARLEAQPTIDLATGQWQGPVTLRHPGAPRFLARLGLPDAGTWLGQGSLSLLAELRHEPGRLTATHFNLTAGSLRASGRMTLNDRQPDPGLSGRVDAEVLPLPLSDSATAVSIPSRLLRGWQAGLHLTAGQVLIGGVPVLRNANAMLDLSDGRLRLSQVAARLGEGAVAGNAQLDASGAIPRVALHATMLNVGLGSGLPLGLHGGRVHGTLDVRADGFTVPTLLSTLAGQASFTMQQVRLPVLDMAGLIAALHPADPHALEKQVQIALSGGTTPFTDAHFVLAAQGGTVRVTQGTMASPAGTASLSGTIDVPSRAEHLHLTIRPAIQGAPELRIDLAGPIDQPARTPDLTGLAAWLTARPAVR